jgi:hypothetical protein
VKGHNSVRAQMSSDHLSPDEQVWIYFCHCHDFFLDTKISKCMWWIVCLEKVVISPIKYR